MKNTQAGVLLLVSKVAGLARNFTKSNTPPWVFFMFFKLCKRYQIAQRVTYVTSDNRLLKISDCFLDITRLDRD